MITNLLQRIARLKKRGGFTLVELLVVIAIIAILAGVALGPITNGIKQARHNAAMQTAHTLGQLCFNYSTDNTTGGNRYPGGNAATVVATLLVTSGYETDASIFYVSGQKLCAAGTTTPLATSNVSWSFTVDTDGSTGLTSAGDTIPIVVFNNGAGSASIPTPFAFTAGSTVDGTVSLASPQGTEGIAVFYKGNNATYVKASGTTAVGVIPASNSDSTAYQLAK
jgi:type IV pilus assembly protein PilE